MIGFSALPDIACFPLVPDGKYEHPIAVLIVAVQGWIAGSAQSIAKSARARGA